MGPRILHSGPQSAIPVRLRSAAGVLLLVGLATLGGLALAGLGGSGGPTAAAPGPVDGDDATPTVSLRGPDADGDGLPDAAERELGTDPETADTDGDGLADGVEVACRDRYPGADPLRHDVYVEVDSTSGATFDAAARERLRGAFADAPVDNPDGTEGISLHLVDSDGDLPENGTVGNRERDGGTDDLADYRSAHFDHAGEEYYYLLVVDSAAYEGDASYAGAGYNGTALVQAHSDDRTMASLVMHELGHAFGIGHGWRGVDADTYAVAEYRSVMNYNALYRVVDYAEGAGPHERAEWAFVAEDRYGPDRSCRGASCVLACTSSPR